MGKIYIYDTLSGKKEMLAKPKGGPLRFFVCGPTVYDLSHIGHARTYLIFDAWVRFLRSQGINLTYLQNITDIDDKIIERAKVERKNPLKLATLMYKEYLKDMKSLGVESVDNYALASKYIKEIQGEISRLISKSFAYITKRGVYFEVSKFSDYGKLSKQNLNELRPGYRIEPDPDKKDPMDFAVWKFPKGELKNQVSGSGPILIEGEPVWAAPFGAGRPGWHIEDTAISEKNFGLTYELHGGGMDLKFPHHEAEIAQARALSGKKSFVKTWMHTGFLLVENTKMSKSLGNFIMIREFLKRYAPEVLRLLVLTQHYRSPLNYTDKLSWETKRSWESINEFLGRVELVKKKGGKSGKHLKAKVINLEKRFFDALADDFNTPKAIASIFLLIKEVQPKLWSLPRKEAEEIGKALKSVLGVLGFSLKLPVISAKATKFALDREKLRVNQQFIQADSLRKKINSLGFHLEDTPLGPFIWPKT